MYGIYLSMKLTLALTHHHPVVDIEFTTLQQSRLLRLDRIDPDETQQNYAVDSALLLTPTLLQADAFQYYKPIDTAG